MAFLCLDLGGTKSVGALFDADGTELGRSGGPAGAISLGVVATLATVEKIWREVGTASAEADTDVVIGLAGIGLRDRVAEVERKLGRFRSVRCVSDGYGALLDATDARPGVLIVIGTGVVAMRLNPDGTSMTASGWGFPAGDLGSGAWIGLQATAELTRYLDGSTAPGTMGPDLAAGIMGVAGKDAAAIMAWLTTGRAGDYARLAPLIAASKDPFAQRVMAAAGREIAGVALCLWTKGCGPIRLAGGLGRVLLTWCRVAAPQLDWQIVETDPLRGLFKMACGLAPEEKLTPRSRLGQADYADK